jgi:hypothetical protein
MPNIRRTRFNFFIAELSPSIGLFCRTKSDMTGAISIVATTALSSGIARMAKFVAKSAEEKAGIRCGSNSENWP